jgi:hypothetical protein
MFFNFEAPTFDVEARCTLAASNMVRIYGLLLGEKYYSDTSMTNA